MIAFSLRPERGFSSPGLHFQAGYSFRSENETKDHTGRTLNIEKGREMKRENTEKRIPENVDT